MTSLLQYESGIDTAVLAPRCPICQSASQPQFEKYGYSIQRCNSCQHGFLDLSTDSGHVQRVYDNNYFEGGGPGYPDYLAEGKLLRRHGRRYAKLLRHYMAPGHLLDVGTAAGFILQGFVDGGWTGEGTEPNEAMAEYGRSQLHLSIRTGPLEQLEIERQYDLVTMIQVVAHFYQLKLAFEVAARSTKPGGFWLIETWNRESWTARLLGSGWHEYSPPSVLHWFSPKDLAILAREFGFVEVARGRPRKSLNGAHAKSLLRFKLEGQGWSRPLAKLLSKLLHLIPDQLEIPYPAEDLFWVLYQKPAT
ncbi:MAG: class I SAM-dependent methyltransferase [Synechococcales cyanobacterium RM1_1_8]|nr:class I SAM-dependent methyltransferase [Synechococcales cyanobacterium RM1_1_8]